MGRCEEARGGDGAGDGARRGGGSRDGGSDGARSAGAAGGAGTASGGTGDRVGGAGSGFKITRSGWDWNERARVASS
jgi:hypothetical protein